jgi:hypothetical protein
MVPHVLGPPACCCSLPGKAAKLRLSPNWNHPRRALAALAETVFILNSGELPAAELQTAAGPARGPALPGQGGAAARETIPAVADERAAGAAAPVASLEEALGLEPSGCAGGHGEEE